jgi:hypothetical protein
MIKTPSELPLELVRNIFVGICEMLIGSAGTIEKRARVYFGDDGGYATIFFRPEQKEAIIESYVSWMKE